MQMEERRSPKRIQNTRTSSGCGTSSRRRVLSLASSASPSGWASDELFVLRDVSISLNTVPFVARLTEKYTNELSNTSQPLLPNAVCPSWRTRRWIRLSQITATLNTVWGYNSTGATQCKPHTQDTEVARHQEPTGVYKAGNCSLLVAREKHFS